MLGPRYRLRLGDIVRQGQCRPESSLKVRFLVAQDATEFLRQPRGRWTQLLTNRSDVGDLAGEQFLGQRIDERRIARDHREPCMQLRPLFVERRRGPRDQRRQKGPSGLGIRIELFDDVGDLVRFGADQAADEAFDPG